MLEESAKQHVVDLAEKGRLARMLEDKVGKTGEAAHVCVWLVVSRADPPRLY